jgi:hypothetical protein
VRCRLFGDQPSRVGMNFTPRHARRHHLRKWFERSISRSTDFSLMPHVGSPPEGDVATLTTSPGAQSATRPAQARRPRLARHNVAMRPPREALR